MNEIIHYFQIENVREMNNLLKAAANVRSKLVGCKRKTKGKKQKKPWWKRRLESQMEDMRKDLGILECTKKEKNRKSKITEKKYHIKSRGVVVVIEELKQRVIAKSAKKKVTRLELISLTRTDYVKITKRNSLERLMG